MTDGGTAFPCEGGDLSGLHASPGMSLRDYFAAQAIVGIIANVQNLNLRTPEIETDNQTALAINAYDIADAMLKARAQQQSGSEG